MLSVSHNIDVFVRTAMCEANNEERFQLQLGITEFILKQQVPLKHKRLWVKYL